ncbi:hypothetical protein KAU32_08715 [bacterium]|nr:hypothetical protein [bacterium]
MNIFKKALKILLFIIICFLLLDIILFVHCNISGFNKGKNGYGSYVYDNILGIKHNEFYQARRSKAKIKTGKYGNRNCRKIRDNEIPIYVLGDSQTDNYVINNNLFTSLLNKEGNGYYFYNFGVITYSPIQEYLLLKKYNISKGSNVLIIFYIGNDFGEFFRYPGSAPTIVKNGNEYSIVYPNKRAFPWIINNDPLIALLHPMYLSLNIKDKKKSQYYQGEDSYEYFKKYSKDYNEGLNRYRYLIKKIQNEYNLSIIILGNYMLTQNKKDNKYYFF